jgi:cytochrome b561
MTRTDTSARYSTESIALHWMVAVSIVALFLLGTYMTSLSVSPDRLRYYNWHKWAGICVLLISVARLAIRVVRGAPPARMAAWQARAARTAHILLYVLSLAVPLAGWAYTSAAGYPVVLFGALGLPDLVAPDRGLSDMLKGVHAWLAWALIGIASLHAVAAIKHHFVDGDHLLRRMWPGTSSAQVPE